MIPLYKPYMPQMPEINKVIYSNNLAYGEYGKQFEKELGKFTNNKNVLAINSYNLAMLVIFKALKLKPNDLVVASPMACLASNHPILNYGLKLIWADIDPQTGTISPDSFENLAVKYKPKAIIHNHFAGYVGYVSEINKIAKNHKILTIDDGIEAFGSEYNNEKLGNLDSDATIFSFNPVRIPNTLDGAAIFFKDNANYQLAKLIRDAGIDRSDFRLSNGEINPNSDIKINGYSATLDELRSYIGIHQLKFVKNLIEKQRLNAESWKKKLDDFKFCVPLSTVKGTNPNYWVFGVLVDSMIDKEKAIQSFRDSGYYASGVHFDNSNYSVFKVEHKQKKLVGVKEFQKRFIAIPSGWWFNVDSFR